MTGPELWVHVPWETFEKMCDTLKKLHQMWGRLKFMAFQDYPATYNRMVELEKNVGLGETKTP